MGKITKIFLAVIAFLFSTQIVFDLLYGLGRLSPIIYRSDTYNASAFIDFIIALIAMMLILTSDEKETK